MKKTLFKKILSVLDEIELYGITLKEAAIHVYEEVANDYYGFKLPQTKEIISFLYDKKALREGANGIDLNPAPTIYAKSNQNSVIEALALLETFIHDPTVMSFCQHQITDNQWRKKQTLSEEIDPQIVSLLLQTSLFEQSNDLRRFHPRMIRYMRAMLEEYQSERPPLLSTALAALFAASIVAHEDMRIDYKNTTLHMIPYRHTDTILSIIPRRGIPHDRDETKALQAFYKDTLFHEFDHACPICHITIPHMLIASHIKPFRDCAHLYEAIDHNNGLLLCRNHDYLFDQGYFTFDEDGYILFAQELLKKEALESSYALRKNYRLPEAFLSEERKMFLSYHREHIFLDSQLLPKKKNARKHT